MKGLQNCSRARVGFRAVVARIIVIGIIAFTGTAMSAAQTLVQNRIAAPIRVGELQAVPGTLHPLTSVASDEGNLSGSTAIQGMSLVFRRSAAQEADLKNLLQQQQTPGSPMYHQWLRPGQFAARYGVSAADLTKVAAWLQSQGFKIDEIPPSLDRIVFSGTAAQVNAAFQTEMHRYMLHGEINWANSTRISVPQAIAGMTLGIAHLNTFRPRPNMIERQVHLAQRSAAGSLTPQYTLHNGSGTEVNFLAPSDIQTIYDVGSLYNNNITGTGQTIAIVGQTDIVQYESDIKNFRSLSGLNASNLPTQVIVPGTLPGTGNPVVSAKDLQEADIDVEWSGAIAKDANILYVTVGGNRSYSVFDSLQYVIQHPLLDNDTKVAPVISISYGGCEQVDLPTSYIDGIEASLEQANAQGQTVVGASGDDGSAQCDDADGSPAPASHGLSVNYPSSSQYVTAAGGTSFSGDLSDQSKYWNSANNSNNGSALSYIPETTWNDSPTLSGLQSVNSLSASGGGASALFSKPSWQAGPGVPSDGKRDVPDISLAADPMHDGYVLCTEQTNNTGTALSGGSTCVYPVGANQPSYLAGNGNIYLFGGTSIAAPQLAAMITLWNQKAGNTTGSGNINPILYQAAQNTPGAFHDVTTGGNAVVCQQGSPGCVSNGANGYVMSCCTAGAGYDQATGLGSVDAAAMAAVWPAISAVNPNFSLVPGTNAVSVNPGNSVNTTLALTSINGFTGGVTLACSNLPADTTCSFTPGTPVNLGVGAPLNVTLTLATTAAARSEMPAQPFQRNWPMQAVFAGVFGLSILGLGRRKRRFFPRGWMTVLLLAAGLMAATAMTACSGGSAGGGTASPPPTPTPISHTTTITVTGTSGSNTASAEIQLTIT